MSNQFKSYYENHGIHKFLITPYIPQRNDIAERKNRTILDMVRSMIKIKKISKEFWVEAVQCAVYIQNRCPYIFLNNKTP
jgi:hypothetical protein